MWKRLLMHTRLMSAAAEGATAGGGDGAATLDASGQAGAGSALASGAPAATGDADQFAHIPEKYRVSGDDGQVDLGASSRRLAEAHASLESRLGSGDIRPKAVEEYSINVPEALKDAFDPAQDEGMQAFLKDAHAAGLTQKQLDLVMGRYFDLAPKLVEGAAVADMTTAQQALSEAWGSPEATQQNLQHAYAATATLAERAGIELDGIMTGPLGNNPEFIRLMAALGPEMQEDRGQSAAELGAAQGDVQSLMASEAYSNPKHPDHGKTHAAVRRHYEKVHGTAPVI